MSIILQGSTSGSITLQEPAVAGSTVLSLPAASGTVMVSGNMPAFYAYYTVDASIPASTTTKLTFTAESYDTANCFDTSNGRFTPTVAGYYQFTFSGQSDFQSTGRAQTWIYKNGSQSAFKEENLNGPASTYPSRFVSALLYANGTTDYFEIYVRQESGISKSVYAGVIATYFCGFLARAA